MALGYHGGKLFILAFDHRGSFQKKMFGIQGDPDEEQTRTISDAKRLIYEGLIKATEQGAPPRQSAASWTSSSAATSRRRPSSAASSSPCRWRSRARTSSTSSTATSSASTS